MLMSSGGVIRRVETALAVLFLGAIVILVAVASVARAVGSPIIWSVEVSQLCFVWLCMLCADLALQGERHFGLSIAADMLGPRARRTVDLFNRVVLIVLLGFLIHYAWKNAVLMHPRRIGATQMHGSLVHGSMVFGLALLLRTMVAQTWAAWRTPTNSEAD